MRILWFLGGALLVIFGVVHSVLGWPALAAELGGFGVPPHAIAGLRLPWHFGGVAMAAFGLISIAAAMTRERPAPAPSLIIGSACVLFAAGLAAVGPAAVPLVVFGLPGALILTAGALAVQPQG